MADHHEKLARTPAPPYYAVVFTSVRSADDPEGYGNMAQRMLELAATQRGYLGIESVHAEDGTGITVSYWHDLDAVHEWGRQVEHRMAQSLGKARWYEAFRLRICRVEQDRLWEREKKSR